MIDRDENGCAPNCPIRILGEQSGVRKSGGGIKTKIGSIKGNGTTHGHMISAYESQPCEPSTGKADRFFKTFPPDPSLWDTVEEAL